MISVVTWKWGGAFGPEYVNRLRSMLERHLHVEHVVYCVTDEVAGLDPRVRVVRPWDELRATPRCLRRLKVFDGAVAGTFGERSRLLCIDLDVVVVDDVTPLFGGRVSHAPVVLWRVGYAGVFSGSVVLLDVGALDGLWRRFIADPYQYAVQSQVDVYGHTRRGPWGGASDQPVLNHYLRTSRHGPVLELRDEDGLVTYFGKGYERFGRPVESLPRGARVVVLGQSDKAVLDEGRYPWVREHWR